MGLDGAYTIRKRKSTDFCHCRHETKFYFIILLRKLNSWQDKGPGVRKAERFRGQGNWLLVQLLSHDNEGIAGQ